MATNINTILSWFKTGFKPTQSQFWASWISFWHKDEMIPQSSISDLTTVLNAKVEKDQFDAHKADTGAHLGLFEAKEDKNKKGVANGYAPLDEFIKISSQYLSIIDDLVSGGSDSLLSAEQGKFLQTQINAINTLLTSNDVNLDTVQELVDAIKTVQTSLSSILVNDLTTGGTTKALTAEMGKSLKALYDALVVTVGGKEASFNKSNDIEADKASTVKWYNAKVIYDFITGGFQRKLVAGTNVTIDNTNPLAPIINTTGGGSGSGIKVWNVKDYGALGDGVTDDTIKIQDTINTCFNAGGGVVYFPNGIYCINGALDSNSQSQIYFPLSTFTSTATLKTLKLLGETPPNQYSNPFHSTGSDDHPNTGVILKSNLLSAGNVVGSREEAVSWGNFNFLHAKLENISIRVRGMTGASNVSPQATALNMSNVYNFTGKYLECATTSQMAYMAEPAPTAKGIIFPKTNNFCFCNVSNSNVIGFYIGMELYEHSEVNSCLIDACVTGISFNNIHHSIHVGKIVIARCRNNFMAQNNSYFYVDHVSLENDPFKACSTPTWNRTEYDLYDVDGTSKGVIRCHIVRTAYGVDYTQLLRNRLNSDIKFIKVSELSTEFNPNPITAPTTGLLAYWKFEEASGNYVDSSGNGKTAYRVNGATSGAGKIRKAMLLNGVGSQYADAGVRGLSYTATGISFCGWFKINTSGVAYQTLFSKGISSLREYHCFYTKSSNSITFSMYNGSTPVGSVVVNSVPENTWFFFYAERVGSTVKAGINGAANSSSCSTSSVDTIHPLRIGTGDDTSYSVNGSVDEFIVYNRGLTLGERLFLYNGGDGNSLP